MLRTKIVVGLAVAASGVVITTAPVLAAHDHYVLTPNGKCHQVAEGQTAIDGPESGGFHRYHENVHVGATESDTAPDTLGDGNAAVDVYKAGPAPEVCDGD